jgi:hypothetical protein
MRLLEMKVLDEEKIRDLEYLPVTENRLEDVKRELRTKPYDLVCREV